MTEKDVIYHCFKVMSTRVQADCFSLKNVKTLANNNLMAFFIFNNKFLVTYWPGAEGLKDTNQPFYYFLNLNFMKMDSANKQ